MNAKVSKISVPKLVFACLLSLLAGSLGSFLAKNTTQVYATLEKPPFAPPSFIFPIVWSILFILMGAASYLIYEKRSDASRRALTAYVIYLVLNILWPVAFFEKGAFAGALILLAGQLFMLFVIINSYSKIDKTAAYLMIPTTLWSLFALYLNMGFLLLNS